MFSGESINHNLIADMAVERLKALEGVRMVVLYGSVARGTPRPDSDVDIAVILDDSLHFFPFALERRIKDAVAPLMQEYGIEVHTAQYFLSEYDEGIAIDSGRKQPPDLLHEVGIVKFECLEHS